MLGRPQPSLHRRSLWLLLALLAIFTPASGLAAPVDIAVSQFRPTQRTIGKAAAMSYLDGWRSDAAARGLSLHDYASTILKAHLATKLITAVYDPQGHVLNDDAHHRIYALLALEKETGVELTIPVTITKDYRGKSMRAFAKDYVNRREKGWYGERLSDTGARDKVRSLPKSYAAMRDDTLRSSVGVAFDELGLKGSHFAPYIEFKLSDALRERGLMGRLRDKGLLAKGARTIPSGLVFSRPILDEIQAMIRTPKIQRVLVDEALKPKRMKKQLARLSDG